MQSSSSNRRHKKWQPLVVGGGHDMQGVCDRLVTVVAAYDRDGDRVKEMEFNVQA